jgi:hypothetical protein
MDKVRKTPCASCPYRRDVPSGVWAADEYDVLPDYDGPPVLQAASEHGMNLFGCHQADGKLCAGWVGHREDPGDLLAVRLGVVRGQVDPSALDYRTDVPLFTSGAEAAEHGKLELEYPSPEAMETVTKIIKVRDKRGDPIAPS